MAAVVTGEGELAAQSGVEGVPERARGARVNKSTKDTKNATTELCSAIWT